MAVKRYNGTSWDTVAGLGAQGAAATSSSITTWVKTASGGETSLTGSSDSSTTLAYTPGQEQFFINGVLQVRGSDYTATNGTSITGISALTAGDIATVTTVNAFSVTGAVPLSTVTANGDLIVGTSAGAVGRLGVGSTGQLLTVSGGVPTWAAAPASGGMTVIASGTLSSTAVVLSSIPQTYKHLQLVMWNTTMSNNDGWSIRYNSVTSNYIRSSYGQNGATSVNGSVINDNGFYFGNGAADPLFNNSFNHWVLDIYDYTNTTGAIAARGNGTYFNTSSAYSTYQAAYSNTATAAAITSLTLKSGGGSFTLAGNYILYGVN